MKKRWRTILLVLIALVVLCSFVHPFGNVKAVRSDAALLQGAEVPPAVMSTVQRSCIDCHSEQTKWPWYSHVAPMSWLVESDVSEGRKNWNMSHWSEITPDERQDKLGGVASMVRNRKMPLPQYLFIHRNAKLSDADVDLLYQWARTERKRVKASDTQAAAAPSK